VFYYVISWFGEGKPVAAGQVVMVEEQATVMPGTLVAEPKVE
jgi:hypothetical protein